MADVAYRASARTEEDVSTTEAKATILTPTHLRKSEVDSRRSDEKDTCRLKHMQVLTSHGHTVSEH